MQYFAGFQSCTSNQIVTDRFMQVLMWALLVFLIVVIMKFIQKRTKPLHKAIGFVAVPLAVIITLILYGVLAFVALGFCSGAPAMFPLGVTGHGHAVFDLVMFIVCVVLPFMLGWVFLKSLKRYKKKPDKATKRAVTLAVIGLLVLLILLFSVSVTRFYLYALYIFFFW